MPLPGQVPTGAIGATAMFGGYNEAKAAGAGVPAGGTDANAASNISAASEMMHVLTAPMDTSTLVSGMMPTATGPQMQVPPQLQRPVKEWQNLPMDTREVVGKGNARARGISNAITGVANFVGQTVTQVKQRDQDKLSSATQRLLMSQDAINQANQYMQYASPEQKVQLQKIIDKNQNLMEKTLEDDPKLRKQLATGLDISFTDPSKNGTDEHKGVMKAFDIFRKNKQAQGQGQAGQSPQYAKQLQEQLPQGAGPDPIRSMQMQLAVKQKEADYKLAQTLIPRLLASKDLQERTVMQEAGRNARFNAAMANHLLLTKEQQDFRWKLAGLQHDYRMDEIQQMYQAAYDRLQQTLMSKELNPITIQEQSMKLDSDYGKGIANFQKHLSDARDRYDRTLAARDAMQQQEGDAAVNDPNSGTFGLNRQLYWLNQDIQTTTQQLTDWQTAYKRNRAIWDAIKNEGDRQRDLRSGQGGGYTNAPAPATTPNSTKPSPYGPPISGGRVQETPSYRGPISQSLPAGFLPSSGQTQFLFQPGTNAGFPDAATLYNIIEGEPEEQESDSISWPDEYVEESTGIQPSYQGGGN